MARHVPAMARHVPGFLPSRHGFPALDGSLLHSIAVYCCLLLTTAHYCSLLLSMAPEQGCKRRQPGTPAVKQIPDPAALTPIRMFLAWRIRSSGANQVPANGFHESRITKHGFLVLKPFSLVSLARAGIA